MYWRPEEKSDEHNGIYDGAGKKYFSYRRLVESAENIAGKFPSGRKLLVTLFCDNSLSSIVAYLAVLRSGNAAMLLNASTEKTLKRRIVEIYSPELIISGDRDDIPDGYIVAKSGFRGLLLAEPKVASNLEVQENIAVLLSTSGTTGSPKFVRLSYKNIQSNAESIASYLEIDSEENAITTLPMSYSYGLSVINSHLLAGANIVCTNESFVKKEFWALFNDRRCTSLAGVPFSYALLERIGYADMQLPSLRTMTQAGGKLADDKVRLFSDICQKMDARFFVMYGQTEATARISYLPADRISEKIGSVGIAVPGGNLDIVADGQIVEKLGVEGEVQYLGPNVMLGYALSRQCLSKEDELGGRLSTGDVGYKDEDGYLYITGRLKRFLKILGLRLNLDEVEQMLEESLSCPVACVGDDDNLHVFVESVRDQDIKKTSIAISSLYQLHHSVVRVHKADHLARTASGKKDYKTLWACLE